MNPRRGLKKLGLRCYIVRGLKASIIIERERPWRFSIRHADMPPGFYMQKFRRLGKARAVAEAYAGVNQ